MINEKFIIFGATISLLMSIPYIIGTLKGTVKPNQATWLILSIAPMLAFAGELDKEVGVRSVITFMSGFVPLLFFLVSFISKKAYWKLSRVDYILAFFSLIGLFLWRLTGEGNVAILFAIVADGLAFTPTLIKAYRYPDTENYYPFVGGTISVLIGFLVLDTWYFADWAFPVYLLIANLLMIYFVAIRPRMKPNRINADT